MFRNLLLLFGIYVLWRYVRRMFRRAAPGPTPTQSNPADGADGADDQAYESLTRQVISDADFEEIDDDRT